MGKLFRCLTLCLAFACTKKPESTVQMPKNHPTIDYSQKSQKEMSIKDAYLAIARSQTTYDEAASVMSKTERAALAKIFAVVDSLVHLRVTYLNWLRLGRANAQPFEDTYDALISELEKINVPKKMQKTKAFILSGVKDQRDYLREWKAALEKNTSYPDAFGDNKKVHPKILSSSQAINNAYGELLNMKPKESEHNRKAFYDALFALDFF